MDSRGARATGAPTVAVAAGLRPSWLAAWSTLTATGVIGTLPIATTVEEVDELTRSAERTGIVAMPGRTLRFEPHYHHARALDIETSVRACREEIEPPGTIREAAKAVKVSIALEHAAHTGGTVSVEPVAPGTAAVRRG